MLGSILHFTGKQQDNNYIYHNIENNSQKDNTIFGTLDLSLPEVVVGVVSVDVVD